MAELPVSGEQYFRDFAFDASECKIERNETEIATVTVLANNDKNGQHLGMLYCCDAQPGDRLVNPFAFFVAERIEIDTYCGVPSLVKAYY